MLLTAFAILFLVSLGVLVIGLSCLFGLPRVAARYPRVVQMIIGTAVAVCLSSGVVWASFWYAGAGAPQNVERTTPVQKRRQ